MTDLTSCRRFALSAKTQMAVSILAFKVLKKFTLRKWNELKLHLPKTISLVQLEKTSLKNRWPIK